MAVVTDPIADFLTRLRNASAVGHISTTAPFSKMKDHIGRILKEEGYVRDVVTEGEGTEKVIRVYLKYTTEDEPVIRGLQRVSKPGLRQYVGSPDVPRVLGGLGVAILSTSKGLLTDRAARKENIGGEVLAKVW